MDELHSATIIAPKYYIAIGTNMPPASGSVNLCSVDGKKNCENTTARYLRSLLAEDHASAADNHSEL